MLIKSKHILKKAFTKVTKQGQISYFYLESFFYSYSGTHKTVEKEDYILQSFVHVGIKLLVLPVA